MQESRLFKIVYHLLDKGRATASELAEKFEVYCRACASQGHRCKAGKKYL